LLENPEALQDSLSKTEEFAKKNQEKILIGVVALLALVGGAFWYNWYSTENEEEAQNELFPAVNYIEKDSVNKAIVGDNGNTTIGLNGIMDNFGSTKAANLSNFYIGVSKMREGKFDEAIASLEKFSANDLLLQGRVYALLGDCYMEKDELSKAIDNYKKAVDYKPNEQFTPTYMLKLGLAYELNKDLKSAGETYKGLMDKFKDAKEEYTQAEKSLAKVEQLMGAK
jgi:tetratricopeptide (TPR) repeat protein